MCREIVVARHLHRQRAGRRHRREEARQQAIMIAVYWQTGVLREAHRLSPSRSSA